MLCEHCSKPIEFKAPYWAHVIGVGLYRHTCEETNEVSVALPLSSPPEDAIIETQDQWENEGGQ